MTRPAGYIRVSSLSQVDGFSLEAQERAIRAYCAAQEWAEPDLFVDEGISAFTDVTEKRPAFSAMLDAATAGDYDVVIVHKLDRFARSLITTLRELARLEKAGVAFVSIGESLDLASPIGKVILATLAAFAQYFSENLSRESRKGLAEKRRQGLHVGGVPFGARRVAGRLELDEAIAPILRDVLTLAATHSDAQTATLMNERGHRAARVPYWRDTTIAAIRQRTGAWLLDQGEEWAELYRAAANRPTRPRVREGFRTPMLSGLMRCTCGGAISYGPDDHRRRHEAGYLHYGRCRSTRFIREGACGAKRRTNLEYYESLVTDWLLSLADLTSAVVEHADTSEERRRIAERRRRWGVLYANEEIGEEEYERARADLARQEAALPAPPTVVRRVGEGVRLAQAAWHTWPAAARNAYLRSLLQHIVIDGREITIVVRPELAPFLPSNVPCRGPR